jgi:hypothetical protein
MAVKNMNDIDLVAKLFSQLDFHSKEVSFDRILDNLTADLPEVFSQSHLLELRITIRERYFRNLINLGCQQIRNQLEQHSILESERLILDALKLTEEQLGKVDIRELPIIGPSVEKDSVTKFRFLKIFSGTISFFLMGSYYYIASFIFGKAGYQSDKPSDIFFFLAAPIGVIFSILFEFIFRKAIGRDFYKGIYGQTNKESSESKWIIIGTLSGLSTPIVLLLLGQIKIIEVAPQLKYVLFIPGLLGIIIQTFGLAFGGLVTGLLVYSILTRFLANRLIGRID